MFTTLFYLAVVKAVRRFKEYLVLSNYEAFQRLEFAVITKYPKLEKFFAFKLFHCALCCMFWVSLICLWLIGCPYDLPLALSWYAVVSLWEKEDDEQK